MCKVNYNEIQVTELQLYFENDGEIYRNYIVPYIENLKKKNVKEKYNKELAIKGWKNIVDLSAKKYARELCSSPTEWNKVFTVADRQEVAVRIENTYFEEYIKEVE